MSKYCTAGDALLRIFGNQLYWVLGCVCFLLVPGQAKGKRKNNAAVLSELIYCTSKSITNNRATEAKENCKTKQGFKAARKRENCKLQHN